LVGVGVGSAVIISSFVGIALYRYSKRRPNRARGKSRVPFLNRMDNSGNKSNTDSYLLSTSQIKITQNGQVPNQSSKNQTYHSTTSYSSPYRNSIANSIHSIANPIHSIANPIHSIANPIQRNPLMSKSSTGEGAYFSNM
jgi:hypothetical protein